MVSCPLFLWILYFHFPNARYIVTWIYFLIAETCVIPISLFKFSNWLWTMDSVLTHTYNCIQIPLIMFALKTVILALEMTLLPSKVDGMSMALHMVVRVQTLLFAGLLERLKVQGLQLGVRCLEVYHRFMQKAFSLSIRGQVSQ